MTTAALRKCTVLTGAAGHRRAATPTREEPPVIISGSLAVVLIVWCGVLIRRRAIGALSALLCALCGFEIAATSVAPTVTHAIGSITGLIGHIHL